MHFVELPLLLNLRVLFLYIDASGSFMYYKVDASESRVSGITIHDNLQHISHV